MSQACDAAPVLAYVNRNQLHGPRGPGKCKVSGYFDMYQSMTSVKSIWLDGVKQGV